MVEVNEWGCGIIALGAVVFLIAFVANSDMDTAVVSLCVFPEEG